MSGPTERRADVQPFASFEVWVRPDDDKIFDGVDEGHIVMQGSRCYVRESMWPAVREALQTMPKVH